MLWLPSNCKEILRNNSFSLITNSSHPSKCVHSFLSEDTTLNTKELPSKFQHYMFTEMSPLTIQQFNHHSWHNSPNPKQPKNKSPHFIVISWSTVSSFYLHIQHKPAMIIPHFLRLSIIRIFLNAAVQVKNATLGGVLTFHKLFQRFYLTYYV